MATIGNTINEYKSYKHLFHLVLFHRPTNINYCSDKPKRYENLTCGNGVFLNTTYTVIDVLQFI